MAGMSADSICIQTLGLVRIVCAFGGIVTFACRNSMVSMVYANMFAEQVKVQHVLMTPPECSRVSARQRLHVALLHSGLQFN